MEPKNLQVLVGHVEIPDALAHRLSDLLVKQTIRERLLREVMDDVNKYEQAEALLIPITEEIEAIKVKITRECIPDEYNDPQYTWNYNGYEVDGNSIEIYTNHY